MRSAIFAVGRFFLLAFMASAFSPAGWADATALEFNKQGLAHLRATRYAEAEAAFREAVKADPSNAAMRQNLGVALLDQGKYNEAIEHFGAALDLRMQKATPYGEAPGSNLNLSAEDKRMVALIHRNYAGAYYGMGKLKEALGHYESALKFNPAEPVFYRVVDASFSSEGLDAWMLRFEDEIRNNTPKGQEGVNLVFQREQAILHALTLQGKYDQVIGRVAGNLEAVRGVKTESKGYTVPIITPFFFFIRTVPATSFSVAPIISNLYAIRGTAYLRKGMLDEAMADFKEGIETDKGGYSGMLLGVALLEKGDNREALYQLRRFMDGRPEVHLGRLYLAIAYRLNGDTQAAEDELKRYAAKGKPMFNLDLRATFAVVEALAWVDQVWGRTEDAARGYAKVIEACPSCGRAHRGLAEIALQANDRARAEEYERKALALMPQDPGTLKVAAALGLALPVRAEGGRTPEVSK